MQRYPRKEKDEVGKKEPQKKRKVKKTWSARGGVL
jgi:hypothetical protein